MSASKAVDFRVLNEGSVWTFEPLTAEAREWVKTNVQLEGWQWLGRRFVVDHRFAAPLLEGIHADGLEVK